VRPWLNFSQMTKNRLSSQNLESHFPFWSKILVTMRLGTIKVRAWHPSLARHFPMQFIACTFLLFGIAVSPAASCSCMRIGPACESALKADAVFIGKVYWSWWAPTWGDGVRLDFRHVKIKILERFVGDYSGWVTLETGMGGGDCGFSFSWGENYLIYAYKDRDGSLQTSICSRTKKASDANADLEYLRAIRDLPTNGWVYGAIEQYTDQLFYTHLHTHPLPEITVHLKGGEGFATRNVASGSSGEYTFPNVPPGRYAISADLPKSLTPYRDIAATVPAKGCVEVNVRTEFNGRLAGRVADKAGVPVHGVKVDAFSAAGVSAVAHGFSSGTTTQDGTFEIGPLPPDAYIIGVNINEYSFDPKTPKTYYPGTPDLQQAKHIRVGEGELVKDLNFRGVQSTPTH
jgi:hypothetical protein